MITRTIILLVLLSGVSFARESDLTRYCYVYMLDSRAASSLTSEENKNIQLSDSIYDLSKFFQDSGVELRKGDLILLDKDKSELIVVNKIDQIHLIENIVEIDFKKKLNNKKRTKQLR